MKKFFAFLAAAGIFFPLAAKEVVIPFTAKAPQIDGHLDDDCWHGPGKWYNGFTTNFKRQKSAVETRFRMCHNGNTLFIAIEAMEPEIAKLRKDKHIADSPNIWMNDSFEIFLSPEAKKSYCYHIILDAAGQVSDAFCEDNNAGGYKSERIWNSNIKVKTAVSSDRWYLEAALPIGSMTLPVKPVFTLNVVRTRNARRPAEVSSFAPNPLSKNLNPVIFVPAKLDKFDPSLFTATIDCPEAELIKTANGFNAKFTLHSGYTGKRMQIVTAVATLFDADGKTVATKKLRFELEPKKFQKPSITVKDIKPGKYLLDVQLTGSGSKKPLLASLRKNITFDYTPIAINVTHPTYRNAVFATMKDKHVRAHVDFKELKGKDFVITLTGPAGVINKVSGKAGDYRDVDFDLTKAADGDYELAVVCGDVSAKKIIRKLPPKKGEVRVDENGVTLVDGKPFFPFGWYGNDDAAGAKSWINSILDTALYVTPESLQNAFARREAMGVKMIIFPYQEFTKTGGWKIFSAKNRTAGLTKEQREYLTKFIPTIRDNPNLLAYYLADEPENRDNNPRWYKEVGDLLRELDPYHPCIMLNWGIPGIRRFYESADILMPDCYPTYYEDGTTGKVRHCSSQWAQAATALRPSWFMPLVASWPARNRNNVKGVPPTYDDIRSQVFQALIHNVKGFNLYAYFESQRFSSLMISPDQIGKTLMYLKDQLLQDTLPDAVKVKTSPKTDHFQAGLKTGKAGNILIAVNTVMKATTAEFTVSSPLAKELFVVGENRSVKVENGKFTDKFAPGETHIYVESRALADRCPSVAGTRKAIDDLRKSRKKAGNLAGMGEMLVADYIDYSAGKLPAGAVEVTASSDPKNFFATAKTGSRYYLVDGLTKPMSVEYTWSPDRKDTAPWVKIKLPASAALGEVKLYTPSGNLQKGTVVVNGKKFPFENPGKVDMLTVYLNGEISNTVLVQIEKYTRGNTGRIAGRLLTEIEVYGAKEMDKNVVLPEKTTPAMDTAATELKNYLEKAANNITADGQNAVFELANDPALADEEWEVKAVGNGKIRLAGGGERGILYAVYNFLEKQIGVRWFSPTVEYVPVKQDIDLTGINLKGRPFFRIRNVYRAPQTADEGLFSARNRMNQEGEWPILAARYGSGVDFGSPSHCHSVQAGYFPVEKYFREHPEYYAIIDGKRNGSLWFGQLCYSRPGLAQELIAKLKEFILADEAAAKAKGQAAPMIYDISLNDSRNFCQCPKCAEKVAKYNASGTVMLVLNEIAAALAEFRPNYRLQTLGYFATTEPPKGGIKPAKNILVRVCNTETFLHVPITHELKTKYRKQVESWAAQAHELFAWEYSITYGSAGRMPYPSEFNIDENMRFYGKNKNIGLFFEHENPDVNDFYDCKVWMEAKLMEDPKLDGEKLLKEFCEKFYGNAGKKVLEYRYALRDAAFVNDSQVSYFFPDPEDFCFLNWETMKKLQNIYSEARETVKDDPDKLHHVNRAFMALDFALASGLTWFYRLEASAAGEYDRFEAMRLEAAERFYNCARKSIDELDFIEKRPVSVKARNTVSENYRKALELPRIVLPIHKDKVIVGPDAFRGNNLKINTGDQFLVKTFVEMPIFKTYNGKINLTVGRWNVSAQKATTLDTRSWNLQEIKGKGPQFVDAGECIMDGDDLILTMYSRQALNFRFNWLYKRFAGKKVKLRVEVQYDGGNTLKVGAIEISEVK